MSTPEIDPNSPEVKALQERMDNATYAQRIVMALGAGHVLHGSSWGFDKDLADNGIQFREVKAEIAKDAEASRLLIPFEIRGGSGLVDILSLDEALKIYRGLVGNLVTDETITSARNARNEALAEMVKFCKEGKSGVVGFYNTNRTSTITIKGQTAPCFRLNAKDFLGILSQAGYRVKTAEGTVATAAQAMQNIPAFMKQLTKAPSSNAVLVSIMK